MASVFDALSPVERKAPFSGAPVRLRVENVCQSPVHVDRGDGVAEPCRRPVWGGDGLVNVGDFTHDVPLCSRCWHVWNAFHGPYITMKANPAAASLSNEGLARLFISRGLDAEPLPPIGAHQPDHFPDDWDLP